jgi:uncharacterized UBP type Zn finger protein
LKKNPVKLHLQEDYDIPIELNLNDARGQQNYDLISCVFHHGDSINHGHYTCN